MTYREKLKMEHPDRVNDRHPGGCYGCPRDYGYGPEDISNNFCEKISDCYDCWSQKFKGEKEMETVDSFKKEDIKAGYVVKLRCGLWRMAVPVGDSGTIALVDDKKHWNYLSAWNDDFNASSFRQFSDYINHSPGRIKDMDIMVIYGPVKGMENYPYAACLSDIGRVPLWKRTEAKKMTVAEINAALGYEVEIVAEKEE